MNMLIAITTFKKTAALDVLLKSIRDNNYTNDIVVADDWSNKEDKDGQTAEKICKKYNNVKLIYNEKSSQLGVAKNKNRLIKYFLENSEKYSSLLLVDDDICFNSPDIESHLNKIKTQYNQHHICGYWTDEDTFNSSKLVGISGNNWFKDFGTVMENPLIQWTRGTQGCFIWITKELVQAAGYFRTGWNYTYGCEHSEYSARLNALCGWVVGTDDGEDPLFPILKRSEKFFHGQNIPNAYSIDMVKVENNMKKYREYLSLIRRGIDLKEENHGLPKKGEKIIEIS